MANNLPTPPPPQSFAEFIKEKMKENDMTQADLAKASDVSKSTINKLYNNKNGKGAPYTPSLHTMMAICIALQTPVNEIDVWLQYIVPEVFYLEFFLANKFSVERANEVLYDLGLTLLTGKDDE